MRLLASIHSFPESRLILLSHSDGCKFSDRRGANNKSFVGIIKQSLFCVFADERNLPAARSMAWAGVDTSTRSHWIGASFHGEYLLFPHSLHVVASILTNLCVMRLITSHLTLRKIFPFIQPEQTYTIRGLENNSIYEAIVQAKNQYGWNEVNNLFNYDYFHPSPSCLLGGVGGRTFSLIINIFN